MTKHADDDTILAARAAALAAATILARGYALTVAVEDRSHGRLRQSLTELMPACQVLVATFPVVRGRVAGLVYQEVEYHGFQGSSALQVVHQVAELLLVAGERWLQSERLTAGQLEKFAEEIGRALPSALDDWLRNKLDPELAELGRELGVSITDDMQRVARPRALAPIERMISPFLAAPGHVVLAARYHRDRTGDAQELNVEYVGDYLAVVTEGQTKVEIRGVRSVRLFRCVVEAGGRAVAWRELLKADMQSAADTLDGSEGDRSTPRFAINPDSLRRSGNRISRDLGKLGYHWHQDGQGARWDAGIQ